MEKWIMPLAPVSKRRQVINFLSNNPTAGLTLAEAKNKYGIANLASTMRSIKSQVETYGNWEIVKERTPRNKVRYFMVDTHPGHRTFGFDRDGARYTLWFLTESTKIQVFCVGSPHQKTFLTSE